MQIFAGVCLLGSCVAGLALGTGLLRAWRRTREVPELSIGITSLTLAASGAMLLANARVPVEEQGALRLTVTMVSLLLLATSSIALGVGFWRIFRPQTRWAAWLCASASLALLAWWVLAVVQGGSGLRGEGGLRPLLYNAGRLAIHVWGAWECFRYHAMLKRRVAIGLADPLTAHRFWLWGLSTAGVVGSIGVGIYAPYVLGVNVLVWPPGLFALGALGLFSAVSVWCAFLPPAFYRRLVQARSAAAR